MYFLLLKSAINVFFLERKALLYIILGDHSWVVDILVHNQHATIPGRERKRQYLYEHLDIRGGLDAQGL